MPRQSQGTDSGRVYGGESAADRLARQRRQFMDAGLELFGTLGYRSTSVRLLCKQAGLIDRYFYKNFHDTEDLLATVYTERLDLIQSAVMKAIQPHLDPSDPERLVNAGLDTFFTAFENSRVARVCWLEVRGVSRNIDVLYTRRIQQFASLLLSVAKVLVPKWNLPDDEAHITMIALVGAISESALYWLLEDYKASRVTLVAANARLVRGLLQPLIGPP